MGQFFQFESDFVESLRCIPMIVRLKLDTCGIKLKLAQWNQLIQGDRFLLVETPCETEAEVKSYRSMLQQLLVERVGETASDLPIDPAPPWNNSTHIPTDVQDKAKAVGTSLTVERWANLTPLQRFALIKLSRSAHENSNFLPALKEFQLVETSHLD